MSGAKAVLFHPASRAWSLLLLLASGLQLLAFRRILYLLGACSFQLSALFSSSTFGYFPVYSSGEQSD
jgi:hypothetical protein